MTTERRNDIGFKSYATTHMWVQMGCPPGDAAARQSVQERVFAGLLFVVLLGESAFVKKTQTPCYYKSFEVLNHCAMELGAVTSAPHLCICMYVPL